MFPNELVAVAVKVIVPSLSPATLTPVIDHVPSDPAVAVWAVVEFVPSLATSEIVSPASAVPLTVTLLSLARLIGLVAAVIATFGGTVFLVVVFVTVVVLPAGSVAVTE